jgi:carbon-monoxide dehydrogenase medium subunit
MYPASFEYVAPTTLDEALALLEEHGDEAKVLAGGQSLIPLLKLRFASPQVLVDINGVSELGDLEVQDDALQIGALVRHKACERSDVLRGRWGTLGDAAPMISDPIVRNLGTVGGSLAHADPQGDWGSVMLAMRAEIVARAAGGTRTIPIDEFFQGPFTTSLEPTEIVTEVRVPDPGPGTGGSYLKLERKVGDYATVGVAAQLTFDNGNVARAGIALTGVGASNIRASAAEESLAGASPGDDAFAQAAELAAEASSPIDDVRGSAEYKRNVVRVFTQRALRAAADAAGGA